MLPWVTQTLDTEKSFEIANVLWTPFDKRLRLLAVCVIKQNGILWKPFLWCHRHLSKTLDVSEGETEFDSCDISLNHIAGHATVLPPEGIKEVSLLIHPLCNKLTAHTVNMLPDTASAVTDLLFTVFMCILSNLSKKSKNLCCVWLFKHSRANVSLIQ